MALVLADRVKETTTSTGTGTVTLAGASTGYQSFSVVGNGNTTYYVIAGQGTSEWEVGIGTYTSAGTTLARTTVLASSNAGSLVTFSAGTKDVFVSLPSTYIRFQESQNTSAPNATVNVSAITSVAASTDADVAFVAKGAGATLAQVPDSATTGGNKRGTYATDWQKSRTAATQVASGNYSTIAGGRDNTASTTSSFIGGGYSNAAQTSNYTTVVGGAFNTASSTYSFVGGGVANTVSTGTSAAIVSGSTNAATGQESFVGSGSTNTASGLRASVIGGFQNTASSNYSFVGGGFTNTAQTNTYAVVVGGANNIASGQYSFVGGGGDDTTAANRNTASGLNSAVVGGATNTASIDYSFVGGGQTNSANTSTHATIGGGKGNTASGNYATVFGGLNCSATNTYAIAAGVTSQASSNRDIAIGADAVASGGSSLALGGQVNTASGTGSSVIGGYRGITRSISGYVVFPASLTPVSNANGVSQMAFLILGRETTDATATVLASTSTAVSTTNQLILANNSAYIVKGRVIANVTAAGNTKAWEFTGVLKRGANAAATSIVGTISKNIIAADAGASTWDIALTADTTNGGLAVTVTGQAATTIRWVCKLETTEVTF